MDISIITATFNSAATIADCLRSVDDQTYPAEHIIIDGASTDSTLEIVRRISPSARIFSEPDHGIYDAMNKGIKLASGDIVGILNSDDVYYDKDVLANISSVMRDTTIDACYSDLVYVKTHDLSKVVRYWRSCQFEPGFFKKSWVPAHPTFFVRKKIYDQYGVFDLNYKLAADFELMARFLEYQRVRALYIPGVFVKMRTGGATNKSISNILNQNFEIFQACRKNNIKISPFFFLMNKFFNRLHQYYLKSAV